MVGGLQRESARYRIGPLTTYAEVAELEGWLRVAEPGEKMVYAIGPALGRNAAAKQLASRWHDEGKVRLHREGSTYIMVARRQVGDARPDTSAHRIGPAEGRLMDVISRLADEAKPLPVLELLAELAGLPTRQAADYRLRILQGAGLVKLTCEAGVRVAEVVATGARTAVLSIAGERGRVDAAQQS